MPGSWVPSCLEGTSIVRRELGLPESRVRAADPRLWFARGSEEINAVEISANAIDRRPNVKRALIILVLLLIAPSSVLAWGANGHRVVGRIAANHLTAEAAVAVTSLIGPDGLDQASTWGDDIRNDPNWQPPLRNPSP